MRRLLVVIGVVLIFTTTSFAAGNFPVETDKSGVYNVWCRQDALYWGAIVGEAHQVRISIGMYDLGKGDGPVLHAQPEVKLLNNWYFIKMKGHRDNDSTMKQVRMVIISMPKKAGHTWKKLYHLTWLEFALVQNTWLIQKNGKTLEFGKTRLEWARKMNIVLDILRNKVKR